MKLKLYIVRMIAHEGGVMCADIVAAKSGEEALERFKKANPIYIADCSPMCKCYEVINYCE